VINLEMALPGFEQKSRSGSALYPAKTTAQRIDMVQLTRDGTSVQIVFTEAKLFSNTNSLRADPKSGKAAKIFKQIDDYENYIRSHEGAICEAYHQACKHLIRIRTLQAVPVDRLLYDAAQNAERITVKHRPRLLIFRTNKDKAMSEQDWEIHHRILASRLDCEIVPLSS
jgi:hypothetical protein